MSSTNVSLPIEGWGGQLNNEEMDQEFQEMKEYDELLQAIVPASPPSLEDLQQEQKQEEEQPTVVAAQEEGCSCACCKGTCACGRGHICDEEEDWRDDWYYEVQQGGLDWNESGYYD